MSIIHPVGMFDSGVGGLSIAKQVKEILPNESIVYVADSKYAPYGERTNEEILIRCNKIIKFMIQAHHIKAVIIACNTATAAAVAKLREEFLIPIIGMEPAIKPANASTKTGKVGIMATAGTIKSAKFNALLQDYHGPTHFFAQPCPGLVEQIEIGEINSQKTINMIHQNLKKLDDSGVDVIVLGCTHFVFIKHHIHDYFKGNMTIIDTGLPVANQAKRILEKISLLTDSTNATKDIFYSTLSSEFLQKFMKQMSYGQVSEIRDAII